MALRFNHLAIFLLFSLNGFAQVGIGTTTPTAALDVTSTTSGVLVPRVALSSITTYAPVLNPQTGLTPITGTLVWNTATAGVFPNNVIPGFYYWNGTIWISVTGASANSWSLTGNGGTNGGNTTTAGTNFIGTTDMQNLDIRTNNAFIARFSGLGEFFVGTLNTALPGDLMNSVAKSTFPWALNGYTSFNAGGVYGLRQAGSTGLWGAVQGELDPTVPAGSTAVYGNAYSNIHNGVTGFKPAGGLGYGGAFYNDLGYSGGVYALSDRRLKKNIQPLLHVLDMIKTIPFYTYNFKTEDYDIVGGDELHYGVMSDELKAIIPSLVKSKSFKVPNIRSLPADKQPRGIDFDVSAVNYMELIPIAIQGIKEQQDIIEIQNEKIARLEKLVQELLDKK